MTTFTTNDTAPNLTGTVNANLTGATVRVNIKQPNKVVLSKTATITDAVTGAWSVSWVAGDLAQVGSYLVEVEVTFASGKIQTFAKATNGDSIGFRTRAQIA